MLMKRVFDALYAFEHLSALLSVTQFFGLAVTCDLGAGKWWIYVDYF
jgi:hypothetical protein